MVATRSRLAVLVAGVSLVAGGLLLGGAAPSQAVFGATTYPGTNLGAIGDGGSPCGTTPGTVRNVTFNVTGLPSGVLSDVRVTGLALSHMRVGELTALLIAPNGYSHVLFARTGVASAGTGSGDSSNLAGTYDFADDAAGNWWTVANATNDSTAIPSGSYRTSGVGGPGGGPGPDPGTLTQLTSAFAGVTHPNGTWTLRFVDTCGPVTGTVTAATLEMVPGPCAFQAEAVEVAQPKVPAANAAVPPAVSAATAADLAVQKATPPVKKAKKKVARAKKALISAQESGGAGAIKKAKANLARAKKKLKAAKAALATAQQGAATAHQALTSAQTAATVAQAQLAAAQAALQACQP